MLPRLTPARMPRRRFLEGVAAAALLPVAAPAAAARAKADAPRVAIVGAGIAGLTSALILQDNGVAADVYEAQQRVGGRMHSERSFWGDGQVAEYCAELIDTSHTTIAALARRYGLKLTDELAAQVAGAEQTIYEHGEYDPLKQLFEDFKPVYRTLAQQVAAAGPQTTYARSTAAGRELDDMSLSAWIERFVPGGSDSDLGTYILVQYVAEYGIEAQRQSSLNMVYWLGRQPGYNPRTGEFVALGPSDQRFHIAGGNDTLPRAIAADLDPLHVHFAYRLTAIARRSDGRIDLSFDTPDGFERVTADKAIVTLPFSVLRSIDCARADFDERKRIAIKHLGYGDHSKLIVQFDRRYWTERGAWPGRGTGDITSDEGFQQAWDASRGQPGRHGLLVDFVAAEQSAALRPPAPYATSTTQRVAEYARDFVDRLEPIWPGAKRHFTGKAVLSHPMYDPFAQGSYSGWLRGQYTSIAGYERVNQGNVLFAGEHCSVDLQGFMEGAAREGARAARDILTA
jgi:monoamine oxidase